VCESCPNIVARGYVTGANQDLAGLYIIDNRVAPIQGREWTDGVQSAHRELESMRVSSYCASRADAEALLQIAESCHRALQRRARTALRQASCQPVERLASVFYCALPESGDTCRKRIDRPQPVIPVRHQQLCSAGWRRCPDVRDKIRDGEIDLVTDRTDNGNSRDLRVIRRHAR